MMETVSEMSESSGNEELTVVRREPEGPVRGGLIVIHEIWGLVDHIVDVAGRFAAQGYRVLAPDLLSHAGVTPELGEELSLALRSPDEAVRNAMQPRMRDATAPARSPEYGQWALARLRELIDELAADEQVAGRIAVTGFCFGGSYAFGLAAADRRVRAAVPFYGSPPDLDRVGDIACPILAFYGDQDARLMESLPAVTEAMTAAGVDFTSQVYPGIGHAFFNDTNPRAYDADAAADAWRRSLAFLDEHLGSTASTG